MKIREINYRVEATCDIGGCGGGNAAYRSAAAESKVESDDTIIKVNTSSLEDAIAKAKEITDDLQTAKDKLSAFLTTAKSETENWVRDYLEKNTKYLSRPYSSWYYDEDGEVIQSRVDATNRTRRDEAQTRIESAITSYNEKISQLERNFNTNINDEYKATDIANKVYSNLNHIQSVITAFEDLASKVDFGDYLQVALDYYQDKGTFTTDPDVHVEVDQDNDKLVYVNDRTGERYDSEQGRRAGRTVASEPVSVAVAIYVAEQRDFPPEMTEAMIYSSMAKTEAIITNGMENGWFDLPEGMTWEEYNKLRYKELTGEDWDPEKQQQILNEYFAALGLDIDDLNAGLFAGIGGENGFDPSMAGFVASGLTMAGTSLYDFSHEDGFMTPEQQEIWASGLSQSVLGDDRISAAEQAVAAHQDDIRQHAQEVAQQQDPSRTPGGTGGCSGGGGDYVQHDPAVDFTSSDGDGGGSGGDYVQQDPTVGDKITGIVDTSGDVVSVVETDIPSSIDPDIAKTIDQQAAEIYFNRSPEEIAAERANALAAVDMAFSGENVEEFKDVLRQGGFNDVDIDVIMNNKEIAVTAYILASESKSLTDIANKLAAANSIQNFDTMYDNGLNRMSLENGLSQSKLMAEVDDSVQDARANVQSARNKYNESVKKANDSIEDAEKKKKEMEEVKKRIVEKSGEDPSKWDDDDVEAYNKAIEEYNKANKLANDAHTEAMNNKELLDQAETNLQETQDKVAEEYLNQNSSTDSTTDSTTDTGTGDTGTGETGTGETGAGETGTGDTETGDTGTGDTGTSEPGKEELNTEDINLDDGHNTEEPTEDVMEIPVEDIKDIEPVETGGGETSRGGTPNYESVEPERKLTSEDIMSLFDGLDDVSSMSSAERTLDAVDLSSLAPEDRVIPGMGVTDVISPSDNINGLSDVSHQILPSDDRGDILEHNGIAAFADSAAAQANKKTDEFKDNKFNGMSGFSMNTQGMSGLGSTNSGTSTSTSSRTSSSSSGDSKSSESKESVAGVKVESSDVKKHTDGVLVDQDKESQVASEVSEDGRSLEYVEID